MIQAPMSAYTPAMMMPAAYQPQAMQAPVQYQQQTPGVIYNYPQTSCYMPANNAAKSQYNGVNIEIINPPGQGAVPGACTMPAQFVPQPTFMPIQPVVMPAAYPAAPTSSVVVNPPQQEQQQVVQQPVAQQQAPAQVVYEAPQQQEPVQTVAPVQVAQQPEQVAQQPVEVPAPVIQSTTAAAAPVVEAAVAPDPSVTPEAFAGRLKTNDLEAQKATIEEIAETVKNNETAGPILLDTQIFDALVEVINKDTSALAAPTPEVLELRQKPQEELSEADRIKASTPSELEKAEINKQYALYTIAYMQERLNNELEKRNNSALELKDLPCIENVITTVKENQNPMLRIGALAALSHIARPEYKADLTTIFELAKSDEDPRVQESAARAIESLNK